MDTGIANILHRGTIALIAGAKTFERGERCFLAGRVAELNQKIAAAQGSGQTPNDLSLIHI